MQPGAKGQPCLKVTQIREIRAAKRADPPHSPSPALKELTSPPTSRPFLATHFASAPGAWHGAGWAAAPAFFLLSRPGAAWTILLGHSFNFCLHFTETPGQAEPKYGDALARPSPPSLPLPRQCGGGSQLSSKTSCEGNKGRLEPQQPHPQRSCLAAYAPSGITTSIPPAAAACSCRGGCEWGDRAETPPRHTHIPAALPFGVKSAGEFQLFQHLYLFWLQFLFRPRYKLEAALLLTSSKLHLLTSLPRLLAGRGLLLAWADALALEVCRKPRSLFSPHPPSLAQGANKGSLQKELVIADG